MRYLTVVFCLLAIGAMSRAQEMPERGYTGPSILSRGGGLAQTGSEEWMRLRPFASLMSFYDTGLTGVILDQQGRLTRADSWGVQASFGAVGEHRWRRSALGMSYRGNLRHYARNNFYDGMDNALGLMFGHQATRRISFAISESAGLFQGGFYGLGGARFYDPSFTAIGENLLFDNRTFVMASTGRMIFQKSARLSFSAGGNGTFMEPRSRALVGIRGAGADGDVSYRVSRNSVIGASYRYTHFEYSGLFGATDIHGVTAFYSRRLGRRWELGLGLGGSRIEAERIQRVRIDPVIAAIIGQFVGIEAFHRIVYAPTIQFDLKRSFRRSAIEWKYRRSVTAGNGLYLTSGYEQASVGYNFTGAARWYFSLDAGYSKMRSFAQSIGNYRSLHGGLGANYRLAKILHLTSRFDSRTFTIQGTSFGRPYHRASLGLSVSPGEVPLALW